MYAVFGKIADRKHSLPGVALAAQAIPIISNSAPVYRN
jgi:hypothetical protein